MYNGSGLSFRIYATLISDAVLLIVLVQSLPESRHRPEAFSNYTSALKKLQEENRSVPAKLLIKRKAI